MIRQLALPGPGGKPRSLAVPVPLSLPPSAESLSLLVLSLPPAEDADESTDVKTMRSALVRHRDLWRAAACTVPRGPSLQGRLAAMTPGPGRVRVSAAHPRPAAAGTSDDWIIMMTGIK